MNVRAALSAIGLAVLVATGVGGAWLVSGDPISLVFFVAYAGIGTYLVARRPRNVIGWLLIAGAWGFAGTTVGPPIDPDQLADGTASWIDFLRAWASPWTGSMTFVIYAAIAFVFPSGRLPAGRWGRIAGVALATATFVSVAPGFFAPAMPFSLDGGITEVMMPNRLVVIPINAPEAQTIAAILSVGVPIATVALAVVNLIRRYRLSTGIARLQLRWLMAAIAVLFVGVVFGLAIVIIFGQEVGLNAWLLAVVGYGMVPIAIGFAVTRYRLFEIDRIVSRTVAYGGVTAVLFAVFATVNLGMQAALGSFASGNTIAVGGSTLVVAALFDPLRRRFQRVVDRRFNRARSDHEAALRLASIGLQDEVDLDRLVAQVVRAADVAVEPRAVAVWRRHPAGPR